jgi:RNA polymerase sigma-70 factor (ECF subfamily)
LEVSRELELFLKSVEQRAFRIARIALRDDQDALDALQEAMIKLIRRYAKRPAEEWPPLFYRILRNAVRDMQRTRQSRNRLFAWFSRAASNEEREAAGPPEFASEEPGALDELISDEGLSRLQQAISQLPPRQREAFLLRNLEELDVRDTALAMGCSEGSVKTHYSRAVQALRERLGDNP